MTLTDIECLGPQKKVACPGMQAFCKVYYCSRAGEDAKLVRKQHRTMVFPV